MIHTEWAVFATVAVAHGLAVASPGPDFAMVVRQSLAFGRASRCAVHHVEEWAKGGRTDIEHLALACDACHAQVNDGPFGWTTITDPTTGRTAWIQPKALDPSQTPEINYRHHPDELIDRARRQQQNETGDDDVP